jgi:hypothetical protein
LASPAFKAFLEAALQSAQGGTTFDAAAAAAAYAVVINFLIAVAMHFGLLRDSAVQIAALAFPDKAAK